MIPQIIWLAAIAVNVAATQLYTLNAFDLLFPNGTYTPLELLNSTDDIIMSSDMVSGANMSVAFRNGTMSIFDNHVDTGTWIALDPTAQNWIRSNSVSPIQFSIEPLASSKRNILKYNSSERFAPCFQNGLVFFNTNAAYSAGCRQVDSKAITPIPL